MTIVQSIYKFLLICDDIVAFMFDSINNILRLTYWKSCFGRPSNNYLIVLLYGHNWGSKQFIKWNKDITLCYLMVKFLIIAIDLRLYLWWLIKTMLMVVLIESIIFIFMLLFLIYLLSMLILVGIKFMIYYMLRIWWLLLMFSLLSCMFK